MLVFFAAEATVFLFFSIVVRFSWGAAYGALRFKLRLGGARADLRVGAIADVGLGLFMDRQVPTSSSCGRRKAKVLGGAKLLVASCDEYG